jgi:hypothetical protein
MWWKTQILKSEHAALIYLEVQKRESALTQSLAKGSQAFQKQHEQQKAKQTEVREKIKVAVLEAIENAPDQKDDRLMKVLSGEAATFLATERANLIASKTFITDRDAALLGKAFPVNVVQFRLSMQNAATASEGIFKTASFGTEAFDAKEFAKTVAGLVDAIVVAGEDAFVSMIHLERQVDVLTKKTLIRLTLDVLRGR